MARMRCSIVNSFFSMTNSFNCESRRRSATLASADRNRCSVRHAPARPADTVNGGEFMTSRGDLDRRSFLVAASAATGGLTLGFAIPFAARATDAAADITCWIAIAPDDTVTIRVARSEM